MAPRATTIRQNPCRGAGFASSGPERLQFTETSHGANLQTKINLFWIFSLRQSQLVMIRTLCGARVCGLIIDAGSSQPQFRAELHFPMRPQALQSPCL